MFKIVGALLGLTAGILPGAVLGATAEVAMFGPGSDNHMNMTGLGGLFVGAAFGSGLGLLVGLFLGAWADRWQERKFVADDEDPPPQQPGVSVQRVIRQQEVNYVLMAVIACGVLGAGLGGCGLGLIGAWVGLAIGIAWNVIHRMRGRETRSPQS